MKIKEFYFVNELTTITGLNKDTIHHLDIPFKISKDHPKTNRPVKVFYYKDFENLLNNSKVFDFNIPEYNKYQDKKRPVSRQFLDSNEASEFLALNGLKLRPRTIHSRIKQKELPAYQIGRKYMIPIIFLIKLLGLSIDDDLEKKISIVTNEPYKFQL
ncbi:helix-turn-helix domain-containing protein [Margalitia sp. FSL K6-0131]|uniref:helix-turn-helix domain-containing protein n=1 Tax=Margalitia sp. FSL K6-0131 TaxID=2954604 RepID=UPI0030F619DE